MTVQPKEMEARIEKMKKTLPEGWQVHRRTRNLASGSTTYLDLTSSVEDEYRHFAIIMKQHFPKAYLTSFGGVAGNWCGTWRIDNFPECSNERVDIHYG
jgi:hypothetical protein